MVYFDNGKWLKNDESDYFGSSLIQIFTDQLEGDFNLHKEETGTQYNFMFKTVKFKVKNDQTESSK